MATAMGTIWDWDEGIGERAGLVAGAGEVAEAAPPPTPLERGLVTEPAAESFVVASGEMEVLRRSALGEALRRLLLLPRRGAGMGGVRMMSRLGSAFGLDSADLVPCWVRLEASPPRLGVDVEVITPGVALVVAGSVVSLSPT